MSGCEKNQGASDVDTSQGVLRVVCFDLGGVVVRICRSWAEACERAGVEVRDPHLMTLQDLHGNWRPPTDAYHAGKIRCETYYGLIAQATNGLYTPDEVQKVHDAWVMEDYPGVADLIAELNAMEQVTTACLSNTNHAHWTGQCARSRAVNLLGIHCVSHELGVVKPNAEIFVRADARFRCEPGHVIFFDDVAENIEAARAHGWQAHEIDHAGNPADQVRACLQALGVT